MDKLTDPNPYEILKITPNAERTTIKRALAACQRENKTQTDRQQALLARNMLFSTEKRLIADALTPTFLMQDASSEPVLEITNNFAPIDWHEIVDPDAILRDDLEALIVATIQHTLGKVPEPKEKISATTEFDGLSDFINEWLKK